MAYPQPFVKVNAEGHFGTSGTNVIERWQAGFHLTKNGGVIGGTSELSSFLTNIRAALTTYHTNSDVASGTACYLDAVSGAYIGTDGKYALGALQTTTRVPLTTPTPGTGTSTYPWATSCVISLRSLLTRGPASHGRIYWPRTGGGVAASTGAIAPSSVTIILAQAQTLINAVNATAATNFGTGTNVGLVSAKGLGFQSPVTRVGIGVKPDHMESRERDIPEAHVFGALTVSLLLNEQLDDEFRDAMRDEFPDSDLP